MAKNKADFLARRANAEGINTAVLKATIAKMENAAREAAVIEAAFGWTGWSPVDAEHMVGVLTSTRYRGGYMYPGSKVTPSDFQAVAWSRPGDSVDGDPVGALEWLNAAPIGTTVEEFYDVGNGTSIEVYQKTQQGWGYVKTHNESDEVSAERQCYLYGHEEVVAKELNVGVSPTFRAIYQEVADQLYYGL